MESELARVHISAADAALAHILGLHFVYYLKETSHLDTRSLFEINIDCVKAMPNNAREVIFNFQLL